jgi:hypothetical protein
MKTERKAETQTKYSPWVYVKGRFGWDNNPTHIEAYRLWMETDGRSWWQRHEWLYEDGIKSIDEWIDSPMHKFPDHYININEQDKNV